MGIFFEKPTNGPDVVGGVWPIRDKGKFWNRSGTTLSRGDVVMLPLLPGIATEIATNDANSYKPGASNDTVWNTVVLPTTQGFQTGGIWAVVISDSVADNGIVECVTFGLVDAYVISAGTVVPGDPLTVTASKNFDAVVVSNEVRVAFYLDASDASISTREVKRVFLHNGLFSQGATGIA